jgi:uncharacterized protein (DUF1697 family)
MPEIAETVSVSNEVRKVAPEHTKLRFEITSKNINLFSVNEEERRKIRKGVVNEIERELEKGNHFEADIVVNKVDGLFHIIDGNHRDEAIRIFLKKYPNATVVVNLAKYENLSRIQEDEMREKKIREKERQIYTKWNSGTRESSTDYLQQHFAIIPKGEDMLLRLPVSVYGTDKKMPVKVLVGAHINALEQKRFEGGYEGSGEKTVKDFMTVDSGDIVTMRAFCKDMDEIFGQYRKGSEYYRQTPLNAFYRIWYDNHDKMDREKFIKRFKTKILNNWSKLNEPSKAGGRQATKTFYDYCIAYLNGTAKKKTFFRQKDPEKEEATIGANINDLPYL